MNYYDSLDNYDSNDISDIISESLAEPYPDFGFTECDFCGEVIEGSEYRGANLGSYCSESHYIKQVTTEFEPNMWALHGSDLGIERISESHYVATKLWNENYLHLADKSFASLSEALHFITDITKKASN